MLLEFDLKCLHFNSIRNFFHYHGEMKPGMMFKIFNNQYALGADQSEWIPVMETGYGQIGSFCWISALDETDFFSQMISCWANTYYIFSSLIKNAFFILC